MPAAKGSDVNRVMSALPGIGYRFVSGCACPDMCVRACLWALSAKVRNRLAHTANGNGAGGSRTTARKRDQKDDTSNNHVGMGLNAQTLAQVVQMLTLLQTVFSRLNTGAEGGDLNALLQSFAQLLPAPSGQGNGKGKKKKEQKKKKKKKKLLFPPPAIPVASRAPAPENADMKPSPEAARAVQAHAANVSAPAHKPTAGPKAADQQAERNPSSAQIVKSNGLQPVWQLRKGDWNGAIMTVEDVAAKLESDGEILAVVLVRDNNELDELQLLVDGDVKQDRKLGVTAVMLSAKGDAPLPRGSITRVPGKRQGKVIPRMAHVVSVCGEGPKLQKTVFTASTVPEAKSTTVLRVSTEARYHTEQSWQHLVDKPAPCVHKWLQMHVPADKQRQVRDVWNLQYECAKGGGKAILTALLRVETSVVQFVLSLSGKGGWFVEPLRWKDEHIPACDVSWVKRLKDEPGPTYLSRVQGMTGNLGLARGWKALGVRVPRCSSATPKQRVKTWKVSGVPRDWGHELLEKELENAGLSSLRLQSKKAAGRNTLWFFTALSAEELDYVELVFGDVTAFATALNPIRVDRSERRPLHCDSTMVFTPESVPAEMSDKSAKKPGTHSPGRSFYQSPAKKKARLEDDASAASQTVPPTVKDPLQSQGPEGVASSVDADMEESRKRTGDTPEKTRTPKKGRQPDLFQPPDGLTRVPNAGAGNCVFLSIGQGLNPDKPKSHRQVRAGVVGHLKKWKERYQPWWDGLHPDGSGGCESFDVYIEKLTQDGQWGGCLELAAAAAHFDCPIIVFGNKLKNPEGYNLQGKKRAVHLWFDAIKEHYEMLKGTCEQAPAPVNGPMQGGRGGSSRSESSCRTRISALPPAPPSRNNASGGASQATRRSALPAICSRQPTLLGKSAGTRASALPSSVPRSTAHAEHELSNAGGSQFSAQLDDATLASCLTDSNSSPPDTDDAVKTGRKKRDHWKCPICGYETGVRKHCIQLKQKHVEHWHPELAKELNLKTLPRLVKWKADTCNWRCPLCPLGIPNSVHNLSTRYFMRMAHRQKVHPEAEKKLFLLTGSFARKSNVRKATTAKANAGAAKRFLDLKAGCHGLHQPEVLCIPTTGMHKAKRNAHTRIFCSVCKSLASTVTALGKMPCDGAHTGGPKRKQLLERLKKLAKQRKGDPEQKANLAKLLEKLTPSVSSSSASHSSNKRDRVHSFTTFKWPLGSSNDVMHFCTSCRRVAKRRRTIDQAPCNGLAWSPARAKLVRKLDAAQAKSSSNKRKRAIQEALDLLQGMAPHERSA